MTKKEIMEFRRSTRLTSEEEGLVDTCLALYENLEEIKTVIDTISDYGEAVNKVEWIFLYQVQGLDKQEATDGQPKK